MRSWKLVTADTVTPETGLALATFINSFGTDPQSLKRLSYEYFLWKINNNPYGRGYITLAVDSDKIVGSASATPKQIRFRGEILKAVEMGDTFTDPNYQSQGIFSALVNTTRERAEGDGIKILYGFPNDNSLPGYEKRCSFSRKHNVDIRTYVIPLLPSFFVRKIFNRFGWKESRRTGTLVNKLPYFCMNLYYSSSYAKIIRSSAGIDSDFDEFDQKIAERYSFMLPRRSSDLKFQIYAHPDNAQFGLIEDRDTENVLNGFAVYKKSVPMSDRKPLMALGDIVFANSSSFHRLWRGLILRAMELDCESIILVATRTQIMEQSMFPLKAFPRLRKELILYRSNLGREMLEDDSRWRISMMDYDGI